VRNRDDAFVEIVIEGDESAVGRFLKDLKEHPPPLTQIHEMRVEYSDERGDFEDFSILKSSDSSQFSGSVIPPDISVCDQCLYELRDPKDKRHDYFFITCTNCGPRYTIIDTLPYDRHNTTMHSFSMCDFCKGEYTDPSNRRFHAQTVACPSCGPKVYLTLKDGTLLESDDPIREAGRLLEEGNVIAVKGNGGFHVATSTIESEPIEQLRMVKHRSQKPFAIIARDLKAVRSFAEVNKEEERLLISYVKPIVLVKKSVDYYLSPLIAPGLFNIGVMLPYTGLHVMLFDGVKEPAFVMTSANPPNQPIITENHTAVKELCGTVDFLLMHNRRIAHRCDDSVLRVHGKNQRIIRRSRGYAPEPLRLKHPSRRCILGVGAEINVTACILQHNKAFISQHIGDVENLSTLTFLREAIDYLVRLTNSNIQAVACDLHPKFTTTHLAQKLAEQYNSPLLPIQHHHAQAASLMGEHNVEEMIVVVCDGYGYGSDGAAWGGEILHCSPEGSRRLGHLQEHPLVGGDLATYYPLRMAAGILHETSDVEEWLMNRSSLFPHGEKEVDLILKQLQDKSTIKTTSCGRLLDAVSAILGVCYERTYEGEPAMKLESAAINGKDILDLPPQINGGVINTSNLVYEIFQNRDKHSTQDLAYSAEEYTAKSLAFLALEKAEELDVEVVGFSGGVAYNEHFTMTIKRVIKQGGCDFIVHDRIPPGDGGISFGQVIAAAFQRPESINPIDLFLR